MKYFFCKNAAIFACVLIFASCSSQAALTVQDDNSGSFSFRTQTGKTVEATIRSFTATDSGANLFDKNAVEMSFSQAGLSLTSLSFPGSADISLSGLSKNLNALIPDGAQPVLVETTSSGGILTITLNTETMLNLVSLMPPETRLYTDLLFAPIFTGEVMSADEYAALIGAMYGPALFEEIQSAVFDFEINVPGIIVQAEIQPKNIGTVQFSERKASFSLLLYKFLSNSNEIKFRIQWKTVE